IPQDDSVENQTTAEKLIEYILDAQLEGGGWNWGWGDDIDPDLTGMALQALAPYYSSPEVASVIEKTLAALSGIQDDDGGFSAWGSPSAESSAQIITALSALNIDAASDSLFRKPRGNPLTALLSYRGENGGFKNGGEENRMTTEQAAYALVAYDRFKKGAHSLYDMMDVDLPTVSVGPQTGQPTSGAAGSAAFDVTTENIADGTYPVTLPGAPQGVTVSGDSVAIASGSGKLILKTATETPAGSHSLRMRLNGIASAAFTLTVAVENTEPEPETPPGTGEPGTIPEPGEPGEPGTVPEPGEPGTNVPGTGGGVTVIDVPPFVPTNDDVEAPNNVESFAVNDVSEITDLPGLADVPSGVIELLKADVAVNAQGVLVADAKAVVGGLSAGGATEIDTDGDILPLPVFRADVTQDKAVLVTMEMTLDSFAGDTVADLALLKLKSDGTTDRLVPASSPQAISHGQYTLTDGTGNAVSPETKIEAGKTYSLSLAIKDNSPYDWDPTPGSVLDPLALAKAKAAPSDGNKDKDKDEDEDNGESGGGCNSGAGGTFALFVLTLVAARRRKAA
ncbi:MAG: terpene cyclase/mutase family protein, partial [Synergistaceae bacterium]|nr:terpene cyclase/mutase family protein [Synergistaceae bacterium]